MSKNFWPSLVLLLVAPVARPQEPAKPPGTAHLHHGMSHGEHRPAPGVTLTDKLDSSEHTITLRIGPLNLPAQTDHHLMPQPADLVWTVPIDGWLLSYTPGLTDGEGRAIPGRVLHHVAFWNENRADFLCPNKEEHIFGAGGELTDWAAIPGFGYPVHRGDRIRVETMVHNPTDVSYEGVSLEVAIRYQDRLALPAAKSVYPAWLDARSCGPSGYELPAGSSEVTGHVAVKYRGILLGVGGHMHDYGRRLVLLNATRRETVARLDAQVDARGQLVSIPVRIFMDSGGYRLAAGDRLEVTSVYDNPTGKAIPDGAMGIVVGYFLPADDSVMTEFRRDGKPAEMPGMSHDH